MLAGVGLLLILRMLLNFCSSVNYVIMWRCCVFGMKGLVIDYFG